MAIPQNTSQDFPLIAGDKAGKPIRCAPELQPAFDRLRQASDRGHHWAQIAIKELNALTTGVLGKSNVYVRPGERDAAFGTEKYYVFLPGLKATVVRWLSGQFCIVEMAMDVNYYHITEGRSASTQMGLYRVSKARAEGQWDLEYIKDGKVLKETGRIVGVADAKCDSAGDAARMSIEGVWDFLGNNKSGVRDGGYDLHFTPGPDQLGDLLSYNALVIDACRGSAVQLANSMEGAREVSDVRWVSDHGGSAVLTQAMQILADRGVTLKGHTIYLHKPRTSPAAVLKLAHQLNLNLNEKIANTGFSLRGAASQYSVAGLRIRNRRDPYNKKHHAMNWVLGIVAVSTPIGVAAAVAGGAAAAMVGGIATAIGGADFVYSIGQSVAQDFRRRFKL